MGEPFTRVGLRGYGLYSSAADRAYREADIDVSRTVETVTELEESISTGNYAIADNPMLLCEAEGIDAVIPSQS